MPFARPKLEDTGLTGIGGLALGASRSYGMERPPRSESVMEDWRGRGFLRPNIESMFQICLCASGKGSTSDPLQGRQGRCGKWVQGGDLCWQIFFLLHLILSK